MLHPEEWITTPSRLTLLSVSTYGGSMVSANVKRWRKVQLKCLTPTLSRQRDVFLRVFLPKGKYAIVPMTSQPLVSGTFWVSLYYDKPGLKVTSPLPGPFLHRPNVQMYHIQEGEFFITSTSSTPPHILNVPHPRKGRGRCSVPACGHTGVRWGVMPGRG
jgi:hypothetical protein